MRVVIVIKRGEILGVIVANDDDATALGLAISNDAAAMRAEVFCLRPDGIEELRKYMREARKEEEIDQ